MKTVHTLMIPRDELERLPNTVSSRLYLYCRIMAELAKLHNSGTDFRADEIAICGDVTTFKGSTMKYQTTVLFLNDEGISPYQKNALEWMDDFTTHIAKVCKENR
jgi:hypothetical protein